MSRSPLDPWSRFEEFSEGERALIQAGMVTIVEQILEAAQVNGIAEDARLDAAKTLAGAYRVCFEIDDAEGREHPSLEFVEVTARMIADGTYAEGFQRTADELERQLEGIEAAAGESNVIHLPSSVDRSGDAA